MPAASDGLSATPRLPHTFRPLGVRFAVYVFGGVLAVVAIVIWFAFPAETRAAFTGFQIATLLALGLGAAVCGQALARSRLVAREAGLTVVNGFKSRQFEWSEILAVTMRPGSPWALLDLSDGTSVAAMGIQGSDGLRATRQVKELRALVEEHSQTPRND